MQIMGCWLWLSYRFEEGSFPGRERVQGHTRQLCEWLNTGLANIQTTEELLAAEAAAAAAASAADGEGAAAASVDSVIPAAGAAGAADTAPEGQVAAAAADVDSSDADEYSDAAFTMHIDEAPLDASDRGFDGEVVAAPTAAAADIPSSSSACSTSSSSDPVPATGGVPATPVDNASSSDSEAAVESIAAFKLSNRQLAKLKKLQKPYIRWTSAVATGPAMATYSDASSNSSSQMLPNESYLGGGLENLDSLLMPEFEASMAAFVRWKLRPRFQVPPSQGEVQRQLKKQQARQQQQQQAVQ